MGLHPLSSSDGILVPLYDNLLAADAASFDVIGIPQGFKHLRIFTVLRGTKVADNVTPLLRFNNDTGNNYKHSQQWSDASAGTGALAGTSVGYITLGLCSAANGAAGAAAVATLDIPSYSATTFWKGAHYVGVTGEGSIGQDYRFAGGGIWHSTSAINRITLSPDANNWLAGSRMTIYGLN